MLSGRSAPLDLIAVRPVLLEEAPPAEAGDVPSCSSLSGSGEPSG